MNRNCRRSGSIAALAALAGLVGPAALGQDPARDAARPKQQQPSQERVQNARADAHAKETAAKVADFEAAYRSRVARIDRLISIYKGKGDDAKVRELEGMKTKLAQRRENAMAGFRKDLGPDNWTRLEKEINSPKRRGVDGRAEKSRGEPNPRQDPPRREDPPKREEPPKREKEPDRQDKPPGR